VTRCSVWRCEALLLADCWQVWSKRRQRHRYRSASCGGRILGAVLSSDDFGSSVERTATLHPFWQLKARFYMCWDSVEAGVGWITECGEATCGSRAWGGVTRPRDPRGKRWSQRSRPVLDRVAEWARLRSRVGWWSACGWGSGMPAPSGQIPPPWAWWENEAPTTRAAPARSRRLAMSPSPLYLGATTRTPAARGLSPIGHIERGSPSGGVR
jgi:hypothetical protein